MWVNLSYCSPFLQIQFAQERAVWRAAQMRRANQLLFGVTSVPSDYFEETRKWFLNGNGENYLISFPIPKKLEGTVVTTL